LVKHYLPNATVVGDVSIYKAGIAVVPPEIGLKLLEGKPVRIEKFDYFGYVVYRNGYHFVGPDKGIIAVFNSNDGPRLIVTGTSKAGVGLALRELSKITGYRDVPSIYVIRSGQFEGIIFKEIGDVNWDGVPEGDELVEDYPLYYEEPFQFYWRVVKGENVSVSGGFIRLVNGTTVYITALGFNVSVSVENNTGVNLTYVIDNVNPSYLNYPENAVVSNTTITITSPSGFSITSKAVSNYTIIAFGDHRPAHRDDPVPEVFIKIVKKVNNASPVFAIDNGDLVYSGRINEWVDLMRVWHWNVPLFVSPGNHEYQGEGKNIYHYLFGPSEDFAFSLGNFTYVFLDDVDKGYTLTSAQWAFLEEKMKEANETGRRVVVVAHAPPYDPRPNGHHTMNPTAAEKLLSLMKQYNSFGIFSHIHINWYGEYEGVPMIITGGAGAPLYVIDPNKGGFYGYAVLGMGKDGSIKVDFVPVK
jgi:Icc-related predicted phosphoesterase